MKLIKNIHVISLILILSLSFQSISKAENISEFEIEGMSVGESLLKYFNQNEIKNEIKDAAYYPNSKKFMILSLIPDDIKEYDNINFHIKTNDKNYIIHSVKGMKYLDTKECLEIKKSVVSEVKDLLPNARISDHTNDYDNNLGNSKAFIHDFYITGGIIRVFCTDWDKEFMEKEYNKIYENSLSVNASSSELGDFIQNEAYK